MICREIINLQRNVCILLGKKITSRYFDCLTAFFSGLNFTVVSHDLHHVTQAGAWLETKKPYQFIRRYIFYLLYSW